MAVDEKAFQFYFIECFVCASQALTVTSTYVTMEWTVGHLSTKGRINSKWTQNCVT